MYNDLFDNICINRKLAKLFGLNVAVYAMEVANITTKVYKKKTYDDNTGFFPLDRKYIEDRTTLNLEAQLICDDILNKAGVLEEQAEDKNKVRISLKMLSSIVASDDIATLEKITKKAKATKSSASAAKKAAIIMNLKKSILESDLELLAALNSWVDAIYAKGSFLTAKSIELFQKEISSFSMDKAVKLKIIEIATIHGYSDATWAINIYKKDYASSTGTRLAAQKIGTSVNNNVTF